MTTKPEALSDEEWIESRVSDCAVQGEDFLISYSRGLRQGIAEGRRREREEADAKIAVLQRRNFEREEAAAREMAEIIISDNPPLGNREFGKDVIELYLQDWKQRKEGGRK